MRPLLILGGGWLATWFFQTNGLLRPLEARSKLFAELRGCGLCSGFWIYLALLIADDRARLFSLPVLVDIVLSAMVYSYAAHLLKAGFMSENGTVYLDSWQPEAEGFVQNP